MHSPAIFSNDKGSSQRHCHPHKISKEQYRRRQEPHWFSLLHQKTNREEIHWMRSVIHCKATNHLHPLRRRKTKTTLSICHPRFCWDLPWFWQLLVSVRTEYPLWRFVLVYWVGIVYFFFKWKSSWKATVWILCILLLRRFCFVLFQFIYILSVFVFRLLFF